MIPVNVQASRALSSPIGRFTTELPSQSKIDPATIPIATVDILSEVKLLHSDETQEFWISVEIEAGPQHSQDLLDPSVDVIFIIDNR